MRRGGVQSQSLTVDRQMRRYKVPRLCFINKMDRTGANARRGVQMMKEKLNTDAILMQLPMGAGDDFAGVIDLITMKACYFDGNDGEKVREEPIPAEYKEEAEAERHAMLESLSMYSDEMMELLLSEEEVPEDLIHKVVRQATQEQGATPVFVGSAFKNKGVQLLLDAVTRYLPSPLDREISARRVDDETQRMPLKPDPNEPFVGMAFKIVEDPMSADVYAYLSGQDYQRRDVHQPTYGSQGTL